VLFDLDDTLLDHRGAARTALLAWSRREGLTDAADVLESRWLVLETEFYRRYQRGELTKEEQRRARVREFFGQPSIADPVADALFAGYWSAYVEAWTPFYDAIPALGRALEAGIAIAILTNGDAVDQRRKVEQTGIGLLGLPVFASSELPAAKPDPRAFVTACASLEVAPERCLMVGDSLESDISGALSAGMPAVLLDRYDRHPAAPVTRIRSLDELRML
jgi:putative hydrolase of the HAD superfamily